jgi:hypothetical protein
MKKMTLAVSIVIGIALLVSVRWATTATDAPPADVLQAPDTTLALALSIEDMVNQADVIAIGNCLDTRSVWVDRSLVTLVTVAVSESLKGAPGETLTVVLPGGVDANRKIPIAMTYPGAPRLTPGEDVFLFLNTDSDVGGGYNVTGFSQGKFSIVEGDDGEPMVSRDLTKVSLQGNNGVRRGSADMTPLASLKAKVKGYLKNE